MTNMPFAKLIHSIRCEIYRTVCELSRNKYEYFFGNIITLAIIFGLKFIKFSSMPGAASADVSGLLAIASMAVVGIAGAPPRELLIDNSRGSLQRLLSSPSGFFNILVARHFVNFVHSYIYLTALAGVLVAFKAITFNALVMFWEIAPYVYLYTFAYTMFFCTVALKTKSEKITQIGSFVCALVFVFLPVEKLFGTFAKYIPFSNLFSYIRTGGLEGQPGAAIMVATMASICAVVGLGCVGLVRWQLKINGTLLHKEA